MTNKIKSEIKIQSEIFTWFNNNYCLNNHNPKCFIMSVPNGGYRNPFEAMQLKASGVRAGVSDLIVLMPNKCLFFELKTDVGKQSDKQIQFQKIVEDLGFNYYVVRSLDSFKNIIYAQYLHD